MTNHERTQNQDPKKANPVPRRDDRRDEHKRPSLEKEAKAMDIGRSGTGQKLEPTDNKDEGRKSEDRKPAFGAERKHKRGEADQKSDSGDREWDIDTGNKGPTRPPSNRPASTYGKERADKTAMTDSKFTRKGEKPYERAGETGVEKDLVGEEE